MINIQLSFRTGQHPAEIATAVVNGVSYTEQSTSTCIAKIARTLVAAAIHDQPWIAIKPNGTIALRGRALHSIAKTTIEESDKGGLRRRIWHPHPGRRGKDGTEEPTSSKEAGDKETAVRELTDQGSDGVAYACCC